MYGAVGGLSIRCETISVGFSLYAESFCDSSSPCDNARSHQGPPVALLHGPALCSEVRFIMRSVP